MEGLGCGGPIPGYVEALRLHRLPPRTLLKSWESGSGPNRHGLGALYSGGVLDVQFML